MDFVPQTPFTIKLQSEGVVGSVVVESKEVYCIVCVWGAYSISGWDLLDSASLCPAPTESFNLLE